MSNRAHTQIMGILNITPDSFSDGGQFVDAEIAIERAFEMCAHGADIIDIGGESTRPGADVVSAKEETARVIPIITALKAANIDAEISIDTRRPEVARAAIAAGANIWNDVTALSFAPQSLAAAAELGCKVILMHMQGTPETMQESPHYTDVVEDVSAYLKQRAQLAMRAGVDPKNIVLDPGIGFGKRLSDNLDILQYMDNFHALGYPILIGASRKSFISMIDDSATDSRLGGSIASALWANSLGASIIRVHDVQETAQALNVWHAIREAGHGDGP